MENDGDYKPERRKHRKSSTKKVLSVDNANSQELISIMKEYTLLYDPMHPSYTDSTKKDRAWHEIAMMIEVPESQCRKMWSNLRDGFRRSYKKRKESNGQPVKPWKYDDEMSFLIPFMKTNDKADMFSFVSIDGMEGSDLLMSSDIELGSLDVLQDPDDVQTQFVSLDNPEFEARDPPPEVKQKIQVDTQFISLDKDVLETPGPLPEKHQKIQVHTEFRSVDKPVFETPGPPPEKNQNNQVHTKLRTLDKHELETPNPQPEKRQKNRVDTRLRSLGKPEFGTPRPPPEKRRKNPAHTKFRSVDKHEFETPTPQPEKRQKIQVDTKFRSRAKPEFETPVPPPKKHQKSQGQRQKARAHNKSRRVNQPKIEAPSPPLENRKKIQIQEPLPEPTVVMQHARVATPIVTTSMNVPINTSMNTPKKTPSKPSTSNYEDIDTFFSCIAATVRQFSSLHLAMAKSRVFAIVSEMEMMEISQNEQ